MVFKKCIYCRSHSKIPDFSSNKKFPKKASKKFPHELFHIKSPNEDLIFIGFFVTSIDIVAMKGNSHS